MNSSTSSSDRAGLRADAARWAGFTRLLLLTAAVLTVTLLALAFLLDPFGTGRTPLSLKEGVRPQGPRTAAASRGRDQAFQGAIFGNSHVQLLSPDELKARTGIPFVSLIAPATGPRETLTLIDWFLRNRKQPARAVIVGVDAFWCTPDPGFPNDKPFPYWLFARDWREYLVGLLSMNVVEELPRRIGLLLSDKVERARRDGYWDYEPNYLAQGYEANPAIRARLATPVEGGGGNATGPFPAATRLEALMRSAPDTALILLRPPIYATGLPVPGSADAAAHAACTGAFAELAARRPKTALVDWRRDRPELRDPNQFFDHSHYRSPIARLIEADIAAALAAMQ